jgi:hypothetical protein
VGTLHGSVVCDLLAQVEGAIFDESTERETTAGKGGETGTLGYGPAKVAGEKSKQSSRESEAVYKQVGASEFNRLFEHLDQNGLRLVESVADADEIVDIGRKQFVEVDARVRVSGMQQMLEFAKSASACP